MFNALKHRKRKVKEELKNSIYIIFENLINII